MFEWGFKKLISNKINFDEINCKVKYFMFIWFYYKNKLIINLHIIFLYNKKINLTQN